MASVVLDLDGLPVASDPYANGHGDAPANPIVPYGGAPYEFPNPGNPSPASFLSLLLGASNPYVKALATAYGVMGGGPAQTGEFNPYDQKPSGGVGSDARYGGYDSPDAALAAQYANQMPWRGPIAGAPTPPVRPAAVAPQAPASNVAPPRHRQGHAPLPPPRPADLDGAPAPGLSDPGYGYVRAMTGNARGAPVGASYLDPNDPRIYRGG